MARMRESGQISIPLWITAPRAGPFCQHVQMTAAPTARPRPRAFWADIRFLLGIVLIAVSVAGVWFVVAAARQTAPVFVAAHTIVPGQAVDAGDLRVVEVALGTVEKQYLSPVDLVPGSVALRTISADELVPVAALGDAALARTTTVVVHSAAEVPTAVEIGTVVEVWAAPQLERGVFDTPRILVAAATVVSVARDDSMIGTTGTAVEIVIERSDVAAALTAIADGSSLSIVPTTGARP